MKNVKIALASIYNDSMQPEVEELGICLITSILREHGYEVLLFCADEHKVDYDPLLAFQPDIIGFTEYKVSENSVNHVIRKVKEILPEIKVCLGGKHPSISTQEVMNANPLIDFVIRGEGEYPFLELVQALETGSDLSVIQNLVYYQEGQIVANELRPLIQDLDGLPYPARDILQTKQLQAAYISTSRGCKSVCGFCSIKLFNPKWRGRSVMNVVDEIEHIMNTYQIRIFNFMDSSLEDPDDDLERLTGIANEILRRGLKISYSGNIRAEFTRKVTPEIMDLLVESGLSAVCIGFEAGNEEDLRIYNKIAHVEENHQAAQLFQQHDIVISPGFIAFNPYSTIDRLRTNIDFLAEYGLAPKFQTRLWAYKGTRIFHKLQEDGLITDETDSLGYRYVHEEIGQFERYLFNYIEKADQQYHFPFRNYSYYQILFLYEVKCYQKLFKERNATGLLTKLDEYVAQHKVTLRKFSDDFANWIRAMLDILEKDGFDAAQLDACTAQWMSEAQIQEFEQTCSTLKKRLLLTIARAGYSELLIDFLRS